MIHYFSDDDNTIGFFQVDQDPAKVAKKISVITGTTFLPVKCDKYEDVGSFEIDTVIIRSNLFCEDFIDLLDYGIAVYIIDY
jgi:hypothetical protein